MKHLLLLAAVGLLVVPAMAGIDLQPISGSGYLTYNMATGQMSPATPETRIGGAIWSCSDRYVNFMWSSVEGEMGLDWGDIAGPSYVGGFGFSEYTNSQEADGDLFALIIFYGEENGGNSAGRVWLQGYLIENVPASTHPADEFWGYFWKVTPNDAFEINGSDLDGDGLSDFGYAQYFSVNTPGAAHGPGVCGLIWNDDPNAVPPNPPPAECPGIEDAFDLFLDPNFSDDPNLQNSYDGTYWFGGYPNFTQFYMELFAPECPNRGDAGRYCSADIDGSFDCLVSLADLAQLLGNYGTTTGATPFMGDVDPYDAFFPGDGDVDLGDLAELLGQYGDDCNWP